mmetsp:Transcript_12260/g.19795  ORF Transcript_12260/g.19795 Transcript_12260/m.19795 type:complete len:229 (+) Transcript_12260:622-1308(+)
MGHFARDAGLLRCAVARARRRRAALRTLRLPDRPGAHHVERPHFRGGEARGDRQRRRHPRGHFGRISRKAPLCVQEGGFHYPRKCLAGERWCRMRGFGQAILCRGQGAADHGTFHLLCGGGMRSQDHGHRSCSCDPRGSAQGWYRRQPSGPVRAQRSFRFPGHLLLREARARSRESQCQRGRHRARASPRRHWRAMRGDAAARDAPAREQGWRREHVHRERHGRRGGV